MTTSHVEANGAIRTARDRPFGLLEQETGNFVGFFETEADAFAAVLDALHRYGPEGVETLALAHFVAGDVESIAEGTALAERALASTRGYEPKRNGVEDAPNPARMGAQAR